MAEDEYAVGDEVEVWDADLLAWVPGVVDGIAQDTPMGDAVMVKTRSHFDGLPLVYGVMTGSKAVIRPRRNER